MCPSCPWQYVLARSGIQECEALPLTRIGRSTGRCWFDSSHSQWWEMPICQVLPTLTSMAANIPCLAWCWLDHSQLLLDHDLGCLCGGQLFSWMSLMFELLMVIAAELLVEWGFREQTFSSAYRLLCSTTGSCKTLLHGRCGMGPPFELVITLEHALKH